MLEDRGAFHFRLEENINCVRSKDRFARVGGKINFELASFYLEES